MVEGTPNTKEGIMQRMNELGISRNFVNEGINKYGKQINPLMNMFGVNDKVSQLTGVTTPSSKSPVSDFDKKYPKI